MVHLNQTLTYNKERQQTTETTNNKPNACNSLIQSSRSISRKKKWLVWQESQSHNFPLLNIRHRTIQILILLLDVQLKRYLTWSQQYISSLQIHRYYAYTIPKRRSSLSVEFSSGFITQKRIHGVVPFYHHDPQGIQGYSSLSSL